MPTHVLMEKKVTSLRELHREYQKNSTKKDCLDNVTELEKLKEKKTMRNDNQEIYV